MSESIADGIITELSWPLDAMTVYGTAVRPAGPGPFIRRIASLRGAGARRVGAGAGARWGLGWDTVIIATSSAFSLAGSGKGPPTASWREYRSVRVVTTDCTVVRRHKAMRVAHGAQPEYVIGLLSEPARRVCRLPRSLRYRCTFTRSRRGDTQWQG